MTMGSLPARCYYLSVFIDTATAKMTMGSLPARCYYLSVVTAALLVFDPVPTSAIPIGHNDEQQTEFFHSDSPFFKNGETSELDSSLDRRLTDKLEVGPLGQLSADETAEKIERQVDSPHFLSTGGVKVSSNVDGLATASTQRSTKRRQRRSRDYTNGDGYDDDVSAEQDDAAPYILAGQEHHGRSLPSHSVVPFSKLDLQQALAAVEDELASAEEYKTRPPAVDRRSQESSKRSVLGRQTTLGQLFLKRLAGKDLGGSWNGNQKGWASNNVRIWG